MIKTVLDKIIILRDTPEETVRGGLFVVTDNDELNTGVVIATGPGKLDYNSNLVPVCVSVGDKISFAPHVGDEVEHDGVTYLVISEHQVLAIFN